MRHEIHGQLAQYLRLSFDHGEACWAGKGTIMSYDDGITWRLQVPGGVSGAARRLLSGEGIGLVRMLAGRSGTTASFASSRPGTISIWDLTDVTVSNTTSDTWADCARRCSAAKAYS